MAVLGLRCCTGGKQGLLSGCGQTSPFVVTSLDEKHGALGHAGFSSCSLWTQWSRLLDSRAQAQ